MNIRIGLYDFFSYTIPGVLYLFNIAWITISLFPNVKHNLNQLINGINFSYILLLFILAYIIGHILSEVARQIFKIIFNIGNIQDEIIAEIENIYPMLKFNLKSKHWSIMYALGQHINRDEFIEIQWHEAIFLMLRNFSFALFIFSIYEVFYFFYTNYNILHIIFSIISFLLSFLMIRRSIEKIKSYYWHRNSAIIGNIIKPEMIISIKEDIDKSSE